MQNKYTTWLVAGTIIATSALSALAHGGATGIVKERMDSMTVMGDAVKTISDMFRSGSFDASLVESNADLILQHSDTKLTALFPEGTGGAPSKAKPEVWSNKAEFTDLARQLSLLAAALKAGASAPQDQQNASGNMMGNSMMGMSTGTDAMGIGATMPTAEMIAEMPVDRVFDMVVRSCASCHTKFRIED